MENKKTVKILKKLIANHNDRIACYETGAMETGEPELKTMFTHFVQVSKKIWEDLATEIRKSGGVPPEGAREGSKFLVAWADVKKALEKKQVDNILSGCEQCERVMVDVYEKVLSDHEDDFSSEEQIQLINAQHKLLKTNLKEVIDTKGLLVHPK
jgi:uncharacterized protein (TIGR02284 family)